MLSNFIRIRASESIPPDINFPTGRADVVPFIVSYIRAGKKIQMTHDQLLGLSVQEVVEGVKERGLNVVVTVSESSCTFSAQAPL